MAFGKDEDSLFEAQFAQQPPRILIVEDEAVVALHLKRELTNLGYIVAGIADDGEQALERLVNEMIDLVLLDIHLSGPLDGIETAKRIPKYLHIPVVYLTAYSEDSTLARASETNPYGYLIKPFQAREVHSTLKMALARSRSDQAVRENEALLLRAACMTSMGHC